MNKSEFFGNAISPFNNIAAKVARGLGRLRTEAEADPIVLEIRALENVLAPVFAQARQAARSEAPLRPLTKQEEMMDLAG